MVCEALAQLPNTLPHHLIILGGDLKGGWDNTSPKYIHVAILPYKSWAGPTLPTFTPRQHPLHASCIDHLTIWDPRRISHQKEDTFTLPTAFPDHHGGLGSLSLPILTTAALTPPLAKPFRVSRFRYHILEPTLGGWKAKVAGDSYAATDLATVMAHSLLDSLAHYHWSNPSRDSSDPQLVSTTIIGLANAIQTILGDAMVEA
jgi:hypothetical protein